MRKFIAGFALGGTVIFCLVLMKLHPAAQETEEATAQGGSRVRVEVEKATLRLSVSQVDLMPRMRERLKRAAVSLLGPRYRVRSQAELFQGGRMEIILRAEVENGENEEHVPSQPYEGTVSEQIVEARFP